MKKFLSKYDGECVVVSVLVGLCAFLVGACIANIYLVAGGLAFMWFAPLLITLVVC